MYGELIIPNATMVVQPQGGRIPIEVIVKSLYPRLLSFKVEVDIGGSVGSKTLTLGPSQEKKVTVYVPYPGAGEFTGVAKLYYFVTAERPWAIADRKTFKVTVKPPHIATRCTLDDFINSMVNNYKKSGLVVGWYDSLSPVIDVTSTVRLFDKNAEKATLTILGSKKNEIQVRGPFNTKPPALSKYQVYQNWLKGQEWERQYCSKNGKWYWIIYPAELRVAHKNIPKPPKPQPKCTVTDFINSMVNNYKKSHLVIGWVNKYSPKLDVTSVVRRVYPDVKRATLVIYGNEPSKVKVIGPLPTKPEALSPKQIVANWQSGIELERMFCSKDKKWYWVMFPAKLSMEKYSSSPTPTPTKPEGGSDKTTLILLLSAMALYAVLSKK